MRAAFCPEAGRIEVREVARPDPGRGEVIVRVRACGICGSDLHWYRGDGRPPPVCPGHEMAGEVAAVGAGVRARAGDRVAVEPMVVCRECAACRAGTPQRCPRLRIVGMHHPGGLAEYVAVPEYALFALPPGLPFPLAALAEPLAVCVHAVRAAGVGLGDRVLVLGAGSVGLLSVLAARAAGAGEVAVTARHPHQRTAAARLGADRVLAAGAEAAASPAAFVDAQPVDVVIETVGGRADTIADGVRAVRPGGTVVVLGVFTAAPPLPALMLLAKEVRLIGAMMYDRTGGRADFERALDLLATHGETLAPLLTHRFGLDEAPQAFAAAADKRGGAIKVSVAP